MTQESKKIFYTFLLDKAALQVIDCWTLHCTAVTVLLIFIKRSECSSLNTCGKFWLRLNPRAEQCDQWCSKPQSLTPVEFTHAWVLLAVPQTADCSTETKKKAACKDLSSADTISFHSGDKSLLPCLLTVPKWCTHKPDPAHLFCLSPSAFPPPDHQAYSFLKYDISRRSGQQESLLDCPKAFLYLTQLEHLTFNISELPRVPIHLVDLKRVSDIQYHSHTSLKCCPAWALAQASSWENSTMYLWGRWLQQTS